MGFFTSIKKLWGGNTAPDAQNDAQLPSEAAPNTPAPEAQLATDETASAPGTNSTLARH